MSSEHPVLKARQRAGFVKLDRILVRVSGPQRVKFLHGLLSNDIAGLVAGQSRLAALMNVKGQQVAWMRVTVLGDAVWCEVPSSVGDVAVDTFLHYKVGAPVRFEKTSDAVFAVMGGEGAMVLREAGLDSPPDSTGACESGLFRGATVRVIRAGDVPAGGFVLHVAPADAEAVEAGLRATLGEPVSAESLDTMRVEEGLPWHGIDVTEENLLHETGQLATYHSSSKGCYLGQEVVARLEGRGGHVNKRLRGLRLQEPASRGDAIEFEGEAVGAITTAGVSPTFGPIAMGYVHRNHAESGTRVTVRGAPAEIADLPFL